MKKAMMSLFSVVLLSTSLVTAVPIDWVQAIAVDDNDIDRTGRMDRPLDRTARDRVDRTGWRDDRMLDPVGRPDQRVDRTTGYPPRTVAATDPDDGTGWGWLGLLGLLGLLGRRRREERNK